MTLDWLRQLLGLPAGFHGHIEDTASVGTLAALVAARQAAPGRRASSSAPSTRTRPSRRRRESSSSRCARFRSTSASACGPTCSSSRRLRGRGDDRDDVVAPRSTRFPRSPTRARPPATWLHVDAAYAGVGGRLPGAPPPLRRLGARRLDRRQPAQVARSCRWTARRSGRAGSTRFATPSASCRSSCASSEEVVSLSEVAIPLGRRFRALKLWAVLRCYGREGLQAMIREHVRLAELFEGWVREEPGWEVAAPRLFSLVCFRREGADDENEALLERVNATRRDLPLAHAPRRPLRAAARDRQRADDRGRRQTSVGRAATQPRLRS